MAQYAAEFEKRGVKLLGLSCDDVDSHKAWIKDIEAFTVIFFTFTPVFIRICRLCFLSVNLFFLKKQPGCHVTYPIAADPKREVIKQLNMVDPDERDETGQLPSRALHIVGPDKKVQ